MVLMLPKKINLTALKLEILLKTLLKKKQLGLICVGLLLIAIVLIFHPFTGPPAETTKLCDVTFGELKGLMYEMVTIICGFNLVTIGVCVSLVRK